MNRTNIWSKSSRFSARRTAALLLCIAALLALTACGSASTMEQKQIFAMDTVMTLTAYGKNASAGLDAATSVISSMEALLDPELPTSTTYAINHSEGANVVVNAQVAKMLSTAKTVYEHSDGALDLSVYPIVKLWGFVDGRYYVPLYDEVSQQLARRAFDQMILTSYPATGSYSVSFPAGTEISFGAIGKGCAAENAVSAMRQAGVKSGIISLGGNVQTLGLKPDDSKWTVAIQDPNNTAGWVGTVQVGETAVVTSGSYQRFFEFDGSTYHHILNPQSGYPVSNSLVSATIICEDGTMADALSTAMFVLGETRALNYWRQYGGFEMILINKSNQVICTKGLIDIFTANAAASNYKIRFAE
ncbi:MAG: FAD:protein FMN transferase [Oscillospiraceae bacterium]|nr:FAD:protein FMN transferase [Oscillospiraceae bacterium]